MFVTQNRGHLVYRSSTYPCKNSLTTVFDSVSLSKDTSHALYTTIIATSLQLYWKAASSPTEAMVKGVTSACGSKVRLVQIGPVGFAFACSERGGFLRGLPE